MTQDRIDSLSIGQKATKHHRITADMIAQFAAVSGDNNPLHLDEAFARQTMFKGIIAHGFLTASFISAVIGTELPGPGCVYMRQDLRFKAPVRIGDVVSTSVTLVTLNRERRRVSLDCQCSVGGTVVLEGSALIYIPPCL